MDMLRTEHIAKMIDHSLLQPYLTDEQLVQECRTALKWHAATVSIKPYHIPLARTILDGTDVAVGSVVGFPHGNSTIAYKKYEAVEELEAGAVQLDMVINIGKAVDHDWRYIESEIGAVIDETKKRDAVLKVIFENDMLRGDDEAKIQLCRICSKLQVDFVKTSTGYCFNKEPDGRWSYLGATEHDIRLMRKYAAPEVQIKAAGNVGSLDTILHLRELGVSRIGTGQLERIMADAAERFGGVD